MRRGKRSVPAFLIWFSFCSISLASDPLVPSKYGLPNCSGNSLRNRGFE